MAKKTTIAYEKSCGNVFADLGLPHPEQEFLKARLWDSGLHLIPPHLLRRAQTAATAHIRNAEQLSLDHLAREFGLHERTLRAAARTGRLQVTFSSRSTFGRPIRLATRVAVQAFIRKDSRRVTTRGIRRNCDQIRSMNIKRYNRMK